jgi:hypothetical protein
LVFWSAHERPTLGLPDQAYSPATISITRRLEATGEIDLHDPQPHCYVMRVN